MTRTTTQPRLRAGLSISSETGILSTPELSVRTRAIWTLQDGALEASFGGGRIRCRAIDLGDFEMWTDYEIEVLESVTLYSIACEWIVLGSAAPRVRTDDRCIACSTPAVHECFDEQIDLVDAFSIRRSASGLPDGWANRFEIGSTRDGQWRLRSVVAPAHDPSDAASDFEFRRSARVSPELGHDPSELREIAAGTTLRVGLTRA